MKFDSKNTIKQFSLSSGKVLSYYSIQKLDELDLGKTTKLPICLRVLLECLIRNYDGYRITENHIYALANWQPNAKRVEEIPFLPARVILQDFTGVPLLVDLATMRTVAEKFGKDPTTIEPNIPVDLIIDHSVQVDFAASPQAFNSNLEMELARNRERYQFLKWGTQAFKNFKVIPPAIGIIHQINLEYLATGVHTKTEGGEIFAYPDSVLGTDSHTTMINGLGIVGWGVGGIEAEAAMLGQPTYFLMPDVVGVYLKGKLPPETTATDLALTITHRLRKTNVVGKFVEFFGPGAADLPVADRAVIANMAPEYGATMGYFPPDNASIQYLRETGRTDETCELFEKYYKAQSMYGIPTDTSQVHYSEVIEIDLGEIAPCVAGPKRPQDTIPLTKVKENFWNLLTKPILEGGYGKPKEELTKTVSVKGSQKFHHCYSWEVGTRKASVPPPESEMRDQHPAPDDILMSNANLKCELRHGSVVLAAITSCTNTSNPTLIISAALLAKKAVERGLKVPQTIKTSFAPGSRAVTEYLKKTGLMKYLEELGFHIVAYGCTTCIGNSGPLEVHIEEAISNHDLIVAAVLSGNRNFEGRVHQLVRANYLMSPPLVIAYAIAGRIDVDLTTEPLGHDSTGKPVFLSDLWPTPEEVAYYTKSILDPTIYRNVYQNLLALNPRWGELPAPKGTTYQWDPASTYIQKAPFFENFTMSPEKPGDVLGARCLAIFGDSITTDHISPAGAIKKDSPAGKYLLEHGIPPHEFNSYGARRGNHEIMVRGTFANVRIKNLILQGEEGGFTYYFGPPGCQSREKMTIYDAAMRYRQDRVPLIIIAGREYGTGSSRDWAAKGPALLGIRAILAKSFERIHRANLVGMGILPIEIPDPYNANQLGLDGSETYDIVGIQDIYPRKELLIRIHHASGQTTELPAIARLDTPVEVEYFIHGGILPYILRQLLQN